MRAWLPPSTTTFTYQLIKCDRIWKNYNCFNCEISLVVIEYCNALQKRCPIRILAFGGQSVYIYERRLTRASIYYYTQKLLRCRLMRKNSQIPAQVENSRFKLVHGAWRGPKGASFVHERRNGHKVLLFGRGNAGNLDAWVCKSRPKIRGS